MIVRAITAADAAAVAAIYAFYVYETAITFEELAPTAEDMAARIATVTRRFPWLVAEADGAVLGYAYAELFRTRAAYRWVAETTVYVAHRAHGRGIGRALYSPLLEAVSAQGYVAAVGAVTLPNAGSAALHEALGFARVGTYAQVGYKFGEWHDVGVWQKELRARRAEPQEPTLPD